MSKNSMYRKSLKKQWATRFKTIHPDGDCYDGVVVKENENFIVLLSEENFEFDGIVILPKSVIKGYRDSRFEKCLNRILCHNGQIKKVKIPTWLENCVSLEDILRQFNRRNIWPIVEILHDKKKDSSLYIGPILKGNHNEFCLHCFDASGKWEKKYIIQYKEIFKLEFGSKYCRYFNSFMKGKKS